MKPEESEIVSAGDHLQPQPRVRLLGWRVGLQKVTATRLIRMHTHLSLSASKRCVDDCLAGKESVLIPKSEQDAHILAMELHRIGAIVSLESVS